MLSKVHTDTFLNVPQNNSPRIAKVLLFCRISWWYLVFDEKLTKENHLSPEAAEVLTVTLGRWKLADLVFMPKTISQPWRRHSSISLTPCPDMTLFRPLWEHAHSSCPTAVYYDYTMYVERSEIVTQTVYIIGAFLRLDLHPALTGGLRKHLWWYRHFQQRPIVADRDLRWFHLTGSIFDYFVIWVWCVFELHSEVIVAGLIYHTANVW